VTEEEVERSRKTRIFQKKMMEIAKVIVPYSEVSHQKYFILWNKDSTEAKRDFTNRKKNFIFYKET